MGFNIYIFFILFFKKKKQNKHQYLTPFYLLIKSLDMKVRDKNKRTNLGKIYLDKIYTVVASIAKVNVTSFKK